MSKSGVSAVSGNTSPIVGEKHIYHAADWYPLTPQSERDLSRVTWELFRKRRDGTFTTTNIRKKGDSSFTFGEASLGNTYRLEAYLHKPEGGGLIITPKPNKIPQISKVELFYVDDSKGNTFSFMDQLRAKAYCINMFNKEVVFTLWEDDAKGGGHNPANMFIEQLPPKKVNINGIATAEFSLTQSLIKKEQEPTRQKPEGKSPVIVSEPKVVKKDAETCVCKKYDLVWGDKVSCDFRKKVVEICADLWGEDRKKNMANGLMAVMYVESATTFSASKIELKPTGKLKSNGKPIFAYRGLSHDEILNLGENFSGAVGLIQFTPVAIDALNKEFSLNLTKRKLALMEDIEQLDYVKKYFKLGSANTKIKTPEDIYLHVFAPKGVGKAEDYVLYEEHKNPTTKTEKTDDRN